MKKRILFCFTLIYFCLPTANGEQDFDSALENFQKKLEASWVSNLDYPMDEYINDLKSLSKFGGGGQGVFDKDGVVKDILVLAVALNEEEEVKRVKELHTWYGKYAYQLPDDLLEKFVSNSVRLARLTQQDVPNLEEMRKSLRVGPKGIRRSQKNFSPVVAELRNEHLEEAYHTAWKVLALSPKKVRNELVERRILQALSEGGRADYANIVVYSLKNKISYLDIKDDKGNAILQVVKTIYKNPSKTSLEGLLLCNEIAIKQNLNHRNYYKSISREIIRRLTSTRAYADQLLDPEMKEIIDRQGYNEKFEDIPLTDDLWKIYKPLLNKRVNRNKKGILEGEQKIIKDSLEILSRR